MNQYPSVASLFLLLGLVAALWLLLLGAHGADAAFAPPTTVTAFRPRSGAVGGGGALHTSSENNKVAESSAFVPLGDGNNNNNEAGDDEDISLDTVELLGKGSAKVRWIVLPNVVHQSSSITGYHHPASLR